MEESWIQTASRRLVVVRALKVACVVGTILIFINQGEAILGGAVTAGVWLKIALTYVVPYCVATFAAVQAIRNPD